MQEQNKQAIYLNPNLQILFAVTLMAVLGVSSITPAFPQIANELNISVQSIGLLITFFTLPGVILSPFLGVLADRYGRKRILIPSLFLFGIAGGACAFVNDFNTLLLFRFLQGVGAASLGTLNITIIGDIFSADERTSAMGYNASVLSIGTAGYPAIGGALALLGWNYPFALPLLAIPIGLLVLFSLKNPEPKNELPFKKYINEAWKSIKKIQVLVLFIISIATFIILYGSYLTYLPLIIAYSFKASSFIIGLVLSSMSIATAITASQFGKLTKAYSKNSLLKIAFFLYAISLISIPLMPNLYLLIIPTLIFGIAQGINIPSIQILMTELAPMEYRAIFMSINGMVLRLGQTLGPVIMGSVFIIWGINGAFYIGAVFAVFIIILLIFFGISKK